MAPRWIQLAERATDAAKAGVDAAKSKLAETEPTPLLGLPPDQPITIEAMLVLLVDVIHEDAPRKLSSRDVKRDGKRRHRKIRGIGMLGGSVGTYAADLLSEAEILCDVADRHQLGLTDEELAAHLLVFWDAVPDRASAMAAIDGSGPSVLSHVTARSRDQLIKHLPDEMSIPQVVLTLWKARGLARRAVIPTSAARPRDIVLPGSHVKSVIEAAERQLGVRDQPRRRLLGVRG
jgi:hypothetical protein